MMTNGVKTRVLTSFVIIYQFQKIFFAIFIWWHMVSKLEFWHHLSSYIACKNWFFYKKSKKQLNRGLSGHRWAFLSLPEPLCSSPTRGAAQFWIQFGILALEFGICNLEFQIWNSEVGIWKLEIGNWKFEIGNWKLEIGN